ncbi:putative exported protein [Leptolyngbya sp. Heron Island J]|nr:putative exported protein [Leptolyngbya sp. Heron Island J]
MKRLPLVILSITLVLLVTLWPRPGITNSGKASVEWLSAQETDSSDGFARVTEPKALEFPQELGSHNEYQTEWWYYTGNLQTESGREFGYQLTFFRRALTPDTASVTDASDWRSNQIYFSHFTISDIENQKFYPHERFSRQSAALSGAQASPYRIWLENWSATEVAPGQVHLMADAEDVALDLMLTETIPPVPQGDHGYSRKSTEPGNASYYYSIVQQQAQGTVMVADESFEVNGLTWKDHEYSTSALSPGTVGWDWFSLQLDNGASLMLYGLRQENGDLLDVSSGTYISATGETQSVDHTEWQIDVLDTWRSTTSKAVYPAHWHIEIPKLDLVLDGKSLIANQELNLSTTYWEGAVGFEGTVADQPVSAKGYIEMTGYADRLDAVL